MTAASIPSSFADRARRPRDGGATQTLGPGDFFGEIALVETGRRTATVTASSPLEFFVLWGGDFRLLEREQPAVAESIRRAVADRLAARS